MILPLARHEVVPDGRTQEVITSWSDIHDPTNRIPGTSWAEEMDILDSVLEEERPDEAACIVEATPCIEACIKESFQSMSNVTRRGLHSKFILSRVSTTIALVSRGQTAFFPFLIDGRWKHRPSIKKGKKAVWPRETTIAPHLDKVYVDLCSKSTKQADRALACLQALMLDAVGPTYIRSSGND